ncbi:ClpA/ClpB-like protein [Brevibacterium sanguinis]|uniref:ClpA/ClpB-like protein n=2 Tax=Brevibacterium TaxID=1696 RepID=A0A366IPU1_9MICO|nr:MULTISPECIES: SRPBCC family protein [Brevibacterium]RBP68051.1 ClpA/ClpB-like protein [Brevibacterium sanguinis]RBP74532.1 ClpA/ClpB-like protein [Brevibacterium celere]
MSRFTDAAATSHTLSVTAMEEASRLGQRTADIDHLFLALVVSEQIAGQVLRSFGITLDAARRAVAAQHSEQLASLGISAEVREEGRIVFHETDGYEWGPRPLEIIRRAGQGGRRGDAAAVLRDLVVEPSGMIEAVLDRLGVAPAAVIRRLDEAERSSSASTRYAFEPGTLSAVSESFAPADVDQVWSLLSDVSRLPEWEPNIGRVEGGGSQLRVGQTREGRSRTERPDGKESRVASKYRAQRIELVAREDRHLVEWRFTYPEAPKSNARRIRIELEPAAGGTTLRILLAWERTSGSSRPVRRWILRPFHRFVLWLQLSQISGGISRAFR